MKITGVLFYKNSSRAIPAQLSRNGNQVVIEADNSNTFDLSQIKLSDRIGNVPRKIHLPDGVLFETSHNENIDLIFQDLTKRTWLHVLEQNYKAVGFFCVSMVVAMIFAYFVGLPWLAKKWGPKIPISIQNKIGEEAESTLDKLKLVGPSKLPQNQIENIHRHFERVKILTNMPNLNLKIVSSRAFNANAFALPNGTIMFTDDMIMTADGNDEGLIGVMFHEVAHVKYNHSMQMMIQNSVLTMGMLMLFGSDVGNLPYILLANSYSRGHESEADVFAAAELKKNGMNPINLAALLGKIQEIASFTKSERKSFEFLSSHPDFDKRIEYLRAQ